jgi:AcrR family transcriptional regulator
MNEIARAAGVSKGTLYVYFADKSRLFEAIVEDEALEKGKIAYNLDPDAMSKPRCGNSASLHRNDVPARRRIVDPHGDGDRRTDAGGRTPVLRERAGEDDPPSRRLSAGPCRAGRSCDRRLRVGRRAVPADVPGDAVPAVRVPGRAGAIGGAHRARGRQRDAAVSADISGKAE